MSNKLNIFECFNRAVNEDALPAPTIDPTEPKSFRLKEDGSLSPLFGLGESEKLKDNEVEVTKEDFKALYEAKKRKPSAGLSTKKKSEVVKKAEKGEDIGKKGKGFEKVASKAAKEYGSKEAGEKVAAAALWKNIKR